MQGAARSYAFGFFGEQRLALVKKHLDYHELQGIPFEFAVDTAYQLSVSVCGNRILACIDGKQVFDFQDTENPYSYGQVGFTVLKGSHCHFRDLVIKADIGKEMS